MFRPFMFTIWFSLFDLTEMYFCFLLLIIFLFLCRPSYPYTVKQFRLLAAHLEVLFYKRLQTEPIHILTKQYSSSRLRWSSTLNIY